MCIQQTNIGLLCKLILQPFQYENIPLGNQRKSMKCVYFYYTGRAFYLMLLYNPYARPKVSY
jgi:hypothetical protein